MLGNLGNVLNDARSGPLNVLPPSKPAATAAKNSEKRNDQIEREWSELPYAMMRLTAARRPWDDKHLYWRDQTVQLGGIDLTLVSIRAQDDAVTYTATYILDDLRRDFSLQPSLKHNELRWSAHGLSNGAKLTTQQLAEILLSKLVTFYATGLHGPTLTASPRPAS